ncbi:hypothetical protein ES692_14780 [Psychroserpens burtonensis]|uniref:Prenyltransferase n=1 Tax=Psychroserpens burtonensis TaxID=49278 RepID=A0A5C7B5Z2_9FLAO|nr:hypothetical protein [Psychroserpens burtonensis]TXE15884.1 hypothetical protein ES692_14780 [Psychroserpens burtonensis]
MRVLKIFLDFYINSSIHVALAVYALSCLTLLQFDIPYDENVLNFIFFASITGYNFVKYFGLAKFHHRGLAQWLKTIQVFSGICFIIMTYYALKLELKTLLYIGFFGLATFLYAIPIIPKKIFIDKQKNLRSIGGLKVYIIAIIWAGVSVFLPLFNNQFKITDDVIITAFQRFLFVLVLMLPFEIRDLNYDGLKLATIPQKIGVKQTKLVGMLLLVLFYALNYYKDDLNIRSLLSSLIISSITLLFLVFAKQNQNSYYSAFWVESLPLIWLGILFMLS